MKLLFAAAHESGIGRETDIETPPVNVRYWTDPVAKVVLHRWSKILRAVGVVLM
jgi:hypothetical protein